MLLRVLYSVPKLFSPTLFLIHRLTSVLHMFNLQLARKSLKALGFNILIISIIPIKILETLSNLYSLTKSSLTPSTTKRSNSFSIHHKSMTINLNSVHACTCS